MGEEDLLQNQTDDCEYYTPTCNPEEFLTYCIWVVILVSVAGLMAGLTTGLLSLDKLNMTILKMEGTEKQKLRAAKILSVIETRHFLLVTLLVVNAAANEALPVVLNKLVDEKTAVLLSVTCVLLFGEIIPSALFTGPKQVQIAAFLTPFVKLLMYVTAPLTYPISKVLDWLLLEDHDITRYQRNELKALVALQKENKYAKEQHVAAGLSSAIKKKMGVSRIASSSNTLSMTPIGKYDSYGTLLHIDEVTVIHGALDLATKTASNIMIPFNEVFMLNVESKLDHELMADIMASGHSRIPVFRGHRKNIIGVLLVKKLIVLDPDDARPISELHLRKPIIVDPDMSCYSILNEFQKGRSHIALLSRQASKVYSCWKLGKDIKASDVVYDGIVTLEDVVEELIQEEIEDETDDHSDLDEQEERMRLVELRERGLKRAHYKFKQLLERIRSRHGAQRTELSEIVIATETQPLLSKRS